ncbi:MAG: phage Gp37/Gp68 family protein [Bacteroidetes bacterium HGW-Bacteroidetes-4]|jgi:protein gp37|nr:MAG: phage Gp37/Gp68 family protein [Bacteroidetes bacterium HGW-Bacteroidetes-4]
MSKIEWTNETWNPIIGCSKVSPGCENCYAETMAKRLATINTTDYYRSVVCERAHVDPSGWNGRTSFIEHQLNKPLKRKKPTMYFVCSMGDLFHESVPFEWIDKIMEVIARSPEHTFQILTKRPGRMLEYFSDERDFASDWSFGDKYLEEAIRFKLGLPLPNVWLGVTAENQEQAIKRVPILLQIPAAVRFVSVEPMLGPVDLTHMDSTSESDPGYNALYCGPDDEGDLQTIIDWVICGGESGHNARPMHPNWVRDLQKQCKDANAPFFFKQWGEWGTRWFDFTTKKPVFKMFDSFLRWTQKDWVHKGDVCLSLDGKICKTGGDLKEAKYPVAIMQKVGKHNTGSMLDDKHYKEFPKGGDK